jgi:hypothetical protein
MKHRIKLINLTDENISVEDIFKLSREKEGGYNYIRMENITNRYIDVPPPTWGLLHPGCAIRVSPCLKTTIFYSTKNIEVFTRSR